MKKAFLITDDYCLTKDIDWFCMINGIPIHVASNGGMLPISIKEKGLKYLRTILWQVLELPSRFDYNLNVDFLKKLVEDDDYECFEDGALSTTDFVGFNKTFLWEGNPRVIYLYARTFVEMACRGFYSLDRNEENGLYHIVAFPTEKYHVDRNIEIPNFVLKELDFNNLESLNNIKLVELIDNSINNFTD